MMNIITHRGIDAERHHPFSESSREAFEFFLKNDFSLEFDIQFTSDKIPVISHDYSLERLSGVKDTDIEKLTVQDFLKTPLKSGHTITLSELLDQINNYSSDKNKKHALHLKHHNQSQEGLDNILNVLANFPDISLLIFDAKPKTAHYIKSKNPKLEITASVAHDFDIKRFNSAVGDTLLSLNEILEYKNLYTGVWLDEWDRLGENGTVKSLYTKENIYLLQKNSFYVTLVSPELHATSPHLLGGESHQDGDTLSKLKIRWQEIHLLAPDAICTDYPFLLREILS